MLNRPEHLEPEGLPTFIISVGTQVVLKSAKRVPGSDLVKPAGSVAEVLEAPASNSRPYLIRFVDGTTMRVKFAELVIRKRELDEELATPGPNLRRSVILRVAVGSQAFGLATDGSIAIPGFLRIFFGKRGLSAKTGACPPKRGPVRQNEGLSAKTGACPPNRYPVPQSAPLAGWRVQP